MNKILFLALSVGLLASSQTYDGGTLAPVIIAGSVVKHLGSDIIQKYKRKDCPVCKGTGKYLSGDGIKMVDCGYCEPESKQVSENENQTKMNISYKVDTCNNPKCKCKECKCKNCGCSHK